MPATSPEEMCRLFQQAMAEGDLDAALSLYDPQAVFVKRSGEVTKDRDDLRRELAPLVVTRSCPPRLETWRSSVPSPSTDAMKPTSETTKPAPSGAIAISSFAPVPLKPSVSKPGPPSIVSLPWPGAHRNESSAAVPTIVSSPKPPKTNAPTSAPARSSGRRPGRSRPRTT